MTGDNNRVRLRKDVLLRLREFLKEKGSIMSGVPGVTLDENAAVTKIVDDFLKIERY